MDSRLDDKIFAVQHDGNLTLIFFLVNKWIIAELKGEQLDWQEV
jgi:hypothetical protein